jgi:hypothetical protein
MRVAIIEKNAETRIKIKNSLKGHCKSKEGSEPSWKIDFFIDPEKFLSRNSNDYDIIFVDCDMGGEAICFDFIHRVYDRTDAELCILTNSTSSNVLEGLLKDDHINSILDKNDIDRIVEHLSYSYAKQRIRNHLINESAVYSEIANEMF